MSRRVVGCRNGDLAPYCRGERVSHALVPIALASVNAVRPAPLVLVGIDLPRSSDKLAALYLESVVKLGFWCATS